MSKVYFSRQNWLGAFDGNTGIKRNGGIIQLRNLRRGRRNDKECVGRAPSLMDDSQLSLSTAESRSKPHLVKGESGRNRSGEPPLFLFCYSFAMATGSF